MHTEIASAATEARRGEIPRPAIAACHQQCGRQQDDQLADPEPFRQVQTADRPADRVGVAPPSAAVCNHGSHTLTARTAADTTTNQPGRSRTLRRITR